MYGTNRFIKVFMNHYEGYEEEVQNKILWDQYERQAWKEYDEHFAKEYDAWLNRNIWELWTSSWLKL